MSGGREVAKDRGFNGSTRQRGRAGAGRWRVGPARPSPARHARSLASKQSNEQQSQAFLPATDILPQGGQKVNCYRFSINCATVCANKACFVRFEDLGVKHVVPHKHIIFYTIIKYSIN